MMDSKIVMELATAVSEANARLDAADDMQKQAYHDSCVAEEALLDYLGSVVTKVARDAEDDFDQPAQEPQDVAPEIEPDSPIIGSFSEVSDEAVRAAGGEPIDATNDIDVFDGPALSDVGTSMAVGVESIEPSPVIDATGDADIFDEDIEATPIEPDFGPVAESTHTIHPDGSMTANTES